MIVKHALPGRLRVHLPPLREPWRARRVEAAIRDVPGVLAAEASSATGNLLIHYDPGTLSEAELLRQLAEASAHPGAAAAAGSAPRGDRTRRKMARHVAEVAGGVAVERLLEVGMRLLIARWA
jgi:cation transport ATPase